jgi:hypothetical protein
VGGASSDKQLHQYDCVVLCCLQMATAPEAIEFFMALFCNTTRIVLLMEKVPWKLLVQVRPAGCMVRPGQALASLVAAAPATDALDQAGLGSPVQPQCVSCWMCAFVLAGVHHCDNSAGWQLPARAHCSV